MAEQEGFVTYDEAAGIGAENYRPPRLFERFASLRDDTERWRYLRDEIAAQARAGRLFLTDLLNQDVDVADCCGDVLFNRVMLGRSTHKQHYFTDPLPPELTSLCIRVRSLNGQTISWCSEMVGGEVMRRGRAQGDGGPRRALSRRVETHQSDVMLTPQQAWLCLKESGKFVVRAKRSDHQQRAWKCEEVRPEARADAEPPPVKVKKTFAEANRQ